MSAKITHSRIEIFSEMYFCELIKDSGRFLYAFTPNRLNFGACRLARFFLSFSKSFKMFQNQK